MSSTQHGPPHPPGAHPTPVPHAPPKPAVHHDPIDEPIALVDDTTAVSAAKKIKQIGAQWQHKQHEWKRTPHATGRGAIRVRSFHGKYSDQGLEHLDDMINEWIDEHPEVEIKFVTSTVGVFEGKIREPALVLNLWY